MDKLKWDREFALEQAADDEELLDELIGIFKDSCIKDYQSIESGLNDQDPEKICAAAHSIKGAAASLGVEAIRAVALDMESDSRDGSLLVTRERIGDLDELLKLLQQI